MSLDQCPDPKTKTPSVQTLGVLLFGLLSGWVSAAAIADCMPEGTGEMAIVERVYDGDTVKLKDGRHVRILGINAPEIDHGNEKSGQGLGEDARKATEAFFNADHRVRLFYDTERVDRYGRTLAHIYDVKGNSLSAYLLRLGLGFHVAIPPNLDLNECLQKQESIARKKNLGVWSAAQWRAVKASTLAAGDTGFKRITGRVVSVHKARSIWLELDGPIAIKITSSDLKNFPVQNWQSWQLWKGQQIEVRGWVTESARNETAGKSGSSSRKSNKSLVIQPRIASNLELIK